MMMENDILGYILNISFKPPLPSLLKVGFYQNANFVNKGA